MSITDAARAAGYSQKWPGQAGHQALENIKQKAPNLFEHHGLDDDTFIEKHIKPALEAMEVKAVRCEDKFIYSKPMIAWGPRVQMIALVAKMKGMVKDVQENQAPGVRVVLIDRAHRPQRPEHIEERILPALGEPEAQVTRLHEGLKP